MEHGKNHCEDYLPTRNVSWIHPDDTPNRMPCNDYASTSFDTVSYDMNSDTMTHNISLSITTMMGGSVPATVCGGSREVMYREPNFVDNEREILLRWDPVFVEDRSIPRSFRPCHDPHSNNSFCDVEDNESKPGGSKRKRDVWTRLGPSSKRLNCGSEEFSDPENETLKSGDSPGAHLVCTFDTRRSRSSGGNLVVEKRGVEFECEDVSEDPMVDVEHFDPTETNVSYIHRNNEIHQHKTTPQKVNPSARKERRSSSRKVYHQDGTSEKTSAREYRRSTSRSSSVGINMESRCQSRESKDHSNEVKRSGCRELRRSPSMESMSGSWGNRRQQEESYRSQSKEARSYDRSCKESYPEFRRSWSRDEGDCKRNRHKELRRSQIRGRSIGEESMRRWSREDRSQSRKGRRQSWGVVGYSQRSLSRERQSYSPSSLGSYRESRRSQSRPGRGSGRNSYKELRRRQSRGRSISEESRRRWSREDRSLSRERNSHREPQRSRSRDARRHSRSRGHKEFRRSSSRDAIIIRRETSRESYCEFRRSWSRGGRSASRESGRCYYRESRRSHSRESEIGQREIEEHRYRELRSRSNDAIRTSSYRDLRWSPPMETRENLSTVSRRNNTSLTRRDLRMTRSHSNETMQSRSRENRSFSISPSPKNVRPSCSSSQSGRSGSCREMDHSIPQSTCVDKEPQRTTNNATYINKMQTAQVGNSSKQLGKVPSQPLLKTQNQGPREHLHKSQNKNKITTVVQEKNKTLASSESNNQDLSCLSPVSEIEFPNLEEKIPVKNVGVPVIDSGDPLSHLFTDDNGAATNILLIAPVPLWSISKNSVDALKTQISDQQNIMKIYVSHESTSGSPCSFMVISFKSVNAAKHWLKSRKGTIVLSGDNGSKLKAYVHFLKKGNWNCKNCKSFNLFMQSLCTKCYRAKNGEASPIVLSAEPTKWVGIAKLDSSFPMVQNVIDSLPALDTFDILGKEMIREPSGLPIGVCVFEVENTKEGTKLYKCLQNLKKNAVYIKIEEKAKSPGEEFLSKLFANLTPSNILLVALIPIVNIPDLSFELKMMEMNLLISLKENDIKYDNISLHVDINVGAPYSYALIKFHDTETAKKWLKVLGMTFNNVFEQLSSVQSKQQYKISPHFSEDNWKCDGCHCLNFSLRSLCHHCFRHEEQNQLGTVSQSSTATRWLAVPGIADWAKTDEAIVAEFRELLKEFILKKIEVLRDDKCQLVPLACVFELQGKAESLRLSEYFTKEGRYCVFVEMQVSDGCSSVDPENVPDVMIVEAPLPECIDLTNEDVVQPNNEASNAEPVASTTQESTNLGDSTDVAAVPCGEPAPSPDLTEPVSVPPLIKPTNKAVYETLLTPFMNLLTTKAFPRRRFSRRELSVVMPESDIISVCPVPRLGKNTQWLYALAFLHYGAKYTSVEYCHGDLFGVPYNYCLVNFTSPRAAKEWWTKRHGSIQINKQAFPNTSVRNFKNTKAFLNFSEKNWRCSCEKENCWTRTVCYNCHKCKGNNVAPYTQSEIPTNYLAIQLFKWYSASEVASIFLKNRGMMSDVVNVKLIRDPRIRKDRYGIYVFETTSPQESVTLRDYYTKSSLVQSTRFIRLYDTSVGTVIYHGLSSRAPAVFHVAASVRSSSVDEPGTAELSCPTTPFLGAEGVSCATLPVLPVTGEIGCQTSSSDTLMLGIDEISYIASSPVLPETDQIWTETATASSLDEPKPDYEAIIWTSFFGFHLNEPPSNDVMIPLCLEHPTLPDKTKALIENSIQEVGLTSKSIIFSYKADVGSPFSYCLISFESPDSARIWFDKCDKGTFQLEVSRPDDEKIPLTIQDCYSTKTSSNGETFHTIKSKLYFSRPNWLCCCGSSNFPLRSICHSCFKHRDKASSGPTVDATKCVGIKMTGYLETVDTSALYDVRKLGFNVSQIRIVLDPNIPRDPFGVVLFEMSTIREGIKFRSFLTKLPHDKRITKKSHQNLLSNLMVIVNNSSGIIFF